MSRTAARCLALCSVLLLSPVLAADTWYVDPDLGTGLADGSSWSDAFRGQLGLQEALTAAQAGDRIFVAEGRQIPTDTGSRTVAFALKNGVAIFGSFAGGETEPEQRPPFGTSDSVLDGDLAGDDGLGMFGDNSFHLITTTGTNASAVIDGFVVRAGAATTGGSNRDRGAGILCVGNVSPSVRNCRFLDHRALFGGAAGYINNGAAPTFTDCTFEGGDGGSFGGAFDIAGGGPVRFDRCLFANNTADRAGALEIFATNGVVVTNCIFRQNTSTGSGGGGGVWMGSGGNTVVANCTFVANASLVNNVGGLRNQGANGATVSNCIFWANTGPGGSQNSANQVNAATIVNHSIVEGGFGTGVLNLDADPAFVDLDNFSLYLGPGSPAIDSGDNTAVPVGVLVDLAGAPRFADVLASPDTGAGGAPVVDMGAYESPSVWLGLGNGLVGSAGLPQLILAGPLTGGSTVDLSLTDAQASSTAFLVAGFSLALQPLKGGVLVPSADLLVSLPTNANGELAFGFIWPVGLPSGAATYYQAWVADGAGPFRFSASNGVQGVTP